MSGRNVIIYNYSGTDKALVIHKTYTINGNTYNTVISSQDGMRGVLASNSKVETVTFEDGVTFEANSMNKAFSDCSALRSVNNIPKNITDMRYAFANCPKLQMTIELNSNFNVTYSDGKYSCPEVEGIFRESATEKDSYIKIDNYEAGGLLNCIIQDGMEEKILRSHILLGTMKKACAPMSDCKYTLDKNNKKIIFTFFDKIVYSAIIYDKYIVDGVEYSTELRSGTTEKKSIFDIYEYYSKDGKYMRDNNLVAAYLCDNVKATDLDYFFKYCPSLVWVGNLPKNSVKSMCYTFNDCDKMEYFPEIPAGVVTMDYTYSNINSLINVEGWMFPDSVESMVGCFKYCYSMVSFDAKLPSNLKTAKSLFYDCYRLKSCCISLASTVEDISYLYYDCHDLLELRDYKLYHEKQKNNNIIILPASAKIANRTFMNTSNLEASVLMNGPFDNYSQIFAWTNIEYTYYNENNFKDDEQRENFKYMVNYLDMTFNPFKYAVKNENLLMEDIVR